MRSHGFSKLQFLQLNFGAAELDVQDAFPWCPSSMSTLEAAAAPSPVA